MISGRAIFKIMDAAGSNFTAVNYNAKKEEKDTGRLTYFDNFGPIQDKEDITKAEFIQYLKEYSGRNKRVKKPVFHATCSTKGKELNHEQLNNIALEIMAGLGYASNPVLIYSHYDTNNNHIHVVSSRIGRDGKKINDSFEGKRANSLLNNILHKNTKQEFNLDLNTALQYQFNTIRQFFLLMENKGYNVLKKQEDVLFYKSGKLQGRIKFSELQTKASPKVSESEKEKEIRQIQALIYKYKKEHSSLLKSNKQFKYTTEQLKFHSDLTEHLKKSFGLEFIFFAGKDHDKPYGYTLIDHGNKKIYKGSEVFNLSKLMNNVGSQRETNRSFTATPEKTERDYDKENSYKAEENVQNHGLVFSDNLEIASSGANTPAPKKRKKKKRKRLGR